MLFTAIPSRYHAVYYKVPFPLLFCFLPSPVSRWNAFTSDASRWRRQPPPLLRQPRRQRGAARRPCHCARGRHPRAWWWRGEQLGARRVLDAPGANVALARCHGAFPSQAMTVERAPSANAFAQWTRSHWWPRPIAYKIRRVAGTNETLARAWRGHGAGVARDNRHFVWLRVARAWRGHGAGVARACPVPPGSAGPLFKHHVSHRQVCASHCSSWDTGRWVIWDWGASYR
eukprot:gene24303-biopygen11892